MHCMLIEKAIDSRTVEVSTLLEILFRSCIIIPKLTVGGGL